MRSSRVIFICVTILVLSVAAGFVEELAAQGKKVKRKYGLTASIQTTQTIILVPLWLSNKMTLAPGLGFNWAKGGNTIINLRLMPRFYLDMHRVASYFSLNAGVDLNLNKGLANTTDATVGAGFGGEYFVNAKFSFGVEGQLIVNITDVGGANTMGAMTGLAAHANVYF